MKNKLLANNNILLTPLRQAILAILHDSNKPLGAYEILNKLKKKRPNAEPPTVYRVLQFLIEAKIVHRIEALNAYVCCSHMADNKSSHEAILLLCKVCNKSFEFEDKNIFESLTQFSKKHTIKIDDALIEIKGTCQNCISS